MEQHMIQPVRDIGEQFLQVDDPMSEEQRQIIRSQAGSERHPLRGTSRQVGQVVETLPHGEQENVSQSQQVDAKGIFRPLIGVVEIDPCEGLCFSVNQYVVVPDIPVEFSHL